MRHFIAYHNEQKMGYSCTDIPHPRAKTSKRIEELEGSNVWLVAGEGKSPKNYYLGAMFTVTKCETDKYPGTDLPNEVSGPGALFGTRICLNSTSLLIQLRKVSANFISGFCEVRGASEIAALKALA